LVQEKEQIMRTQHEDSRRCGFSLIEVLAVVVTVLLLLAVLPAILGRSRKPRHGITCVTNLKQVALASRMWSNDHGDRFPWQVSTNEGGTMEFVASPEVFRHFEAMSNEMVTPRILICPRDPERLRATRFAPSLANSNLSYFVGLDANETRPQSILTGDRNIMGGVTNGALLSFRTNDVPQWAPSIHTNQGNLALGDGSVQQLTDQLLARQFQSAFQGQTAAVVSVSIPRTPEDVPGQLPPAGFRLPWPLIGSVLATAAIVGTWLMIRRRLLATSMQPNQCQ
jgi:hypothetical protein